MADLTSSQEQEPAELLAGDEQLLRELTERARTGRLKLTGEGGLLGRLTKMVVEAPWKARWMIISAMAGTTRPAAMAAIPAMVTGPRLCSPIRGRWKSRCRGTGTRVSSRKSSLKGSGG